MLTREQTCGSVGIPTVPPPILQVLQPRFDPTFSRHSHGFRRARAHDAGLEKFSTGCAPRAGYGGLALPLPLGARLLIEAALPEFRVEPRSLHFTLKPTERSLKALIVLNGYFQETSLLW